MVVQEVSQFWKSFNMLRADFGAIDSKMQCLLFKQYCCTFHEAPLWRNNSASPRYVCVVWHKALRRVWILSSRTHCNTIYLLSTSEPMEVIIQRRFINFANSIHNNEVLSTIANVAKNNPFSTFGYNYANSITNHINEWYSNILPDEILYIGTVR